MFLFFRISTSETTERRQKNKQKNPTPLIFHHTKCMKKQRHPFSQVCRVCRCQHPFVHIESWTGAMTQLSLICMRSCQGVMAQTVPVHTAQIRETKQSEKCGLFPSFSKCLGKEKWKLNSFQFEYYFTKVKTFHLWPRMIYVFLTPHISLCRSASLDLSISQGQNILHRELL